MLPDFTKIKEKFGEEYNKYLQKLTKQDPLFTGIKEEYLFEGNRMSNRPETGHSESHYQKYSSELSVNTDEIIKKGPQAFFEKIQGIADEIKEEKAKFLFRTVKEVTEETGNIVDAKGKPIEFETFYEMLDKIWIDFDENSNPIFPSLIMHPEMFPSFQKKIVEWESKTEYKKKMEELIENKRNLWNDRESNRKLVD
jgi:hypothetical protein